MGQADIRLRHCESWQTRNCNWNWNWYWDLYSKLGACIRHASQVSIAIVNHFDRPKGAKSLTARSHKLKAPNCSAKMGDFNSTRSNLMRFNRSIDRLYCVACIVIVWPVTDLLLLLLLLSLNCFYERFMIYLRFYGWSCASHNDRHSTSMTTAMRSPRRCDLPTLIGGAQRLLRFICSIMASLTLSDCSGAPLHAMRSLSGCSPTPSLPPLIT